MIATHPRIFGAPLAPTTRRGNVAALLALPHVRAVSELDASLDAEGHVTGSVPVRGNLFADAHLATILVQQGVGPLYSSDRDFRKFESLEVWDPFA